MLRFSYHLHEYVDEYVLYMKYFYMKICKTDEL